MAPVSDWRPCRNPAVRSELLDDGTWVLFNPQADLAQVLNVTAGIIWEYCDGTHDVPALSEALGEYYPDSAPQTRQAAVALMLAEFTRAGLVQQP